MSDISLLKKALQATKMTFAQAEEKVKAEASKQRVERYKISEEGEYNVRICPLMPTLDADGNPQEMDRIGYEYPFHQQFLKIEVPAKKKGGKPSSMSVPVIHATDKGVDFSADLIDEYVKIAKEYGDEAVTKKVTSGSFDGGLRWGYKHSMFVIDMEKRKDGVKLLDLSQAQYRALEDAKMSIWKDLREDDPDCGCPISDFESAYPVRIKRSKENGKVSYTFMVNTVKKPGALTDDEIDKLLTMERIPEVIYRYTRYQFEATLEFLKQYDEKLQIDVCEQDDFKAIVEKIKGELPADDTSHFSLTGTSKTEDGKIVKAGEITIDSLWAACDALADGDVDENANAELREQIRQFVTDNDIDIRLGHSKTNEQLLEEIEELMNSKPNGDKAEPEAKTEEKKPEVADEPEKDDEPADDDKEEEEADEEPARPARRRAPRPSDDDDEDEDNDVAEEPAKEEKPAEEEAAPVRRRRR